MTADNFSNAEKLACVEKEIKRRRKDYPSKIHKHRLSLHKAQEEIAIMVAIAADYRLLAQREKLL